MMLIIKIHSKSWLKELKELVSLLDQFITFHLNTRMEKYLMLIRPSFVFNGTAISQKKLFRPKKISPKNNIFYQKKSSPNKNFAKK